MMRAIALDDDQLSLQMLKDCCSTEQSIDLVQTFLDPELAMTFLRSNHIDLIFLDIDMPKISGLDFYRRFGQHRLVIFTTAHSKYAATSYELDAVDYLVKPYSLSRFLQAAQKAEIHYKIKNGLGSIPEPAIYLRSDFRLVKVYLSQIRFIQSVKDYVNVHCWDGKTILSRMTLKSLEELLPKERFLRVHRSYIVSKDILTEIRNKTILHENVEIPIGEIYEEAVNKHFLNQQ